METLQLPRDQLHLGAQFATSVAIGLLIGLERQRNPTAKAGVRTCALVALFGTAAAMLGQSLDTPWIVAAGLLLVGAMIIAAYHGESIEGDSGTTTVIAVALCYVLGALVWFGFSQIAVALAIGITILLHFKAELHAFSEKLAPHDVSIVLQFAVLSLIVLPLLPDEGFGPYRAFNPHHVWLMVVLVSGLSLAGYFALRLFGHRRGLLMVGLFGGLVSSAVTTFVHARQAGHSAQRSPASAAVIALSNLVVPLRISFLAAASAPAIIPTLLPPLALGLACGVLPAVHRFRAAAGGSAAAVPEVSNPASLPVALGFGTFYASVLLLSAWLSQYAGSGGLMAMAAISGIVDVDAITLSASRLFDTGALTAKAASAAVVICFVSASLFKLAMIGWLGGRDLIRRAWLPIVTPVVGAALGTALMLVL